MTDKGFPLNFADSGKKLEVTGIIGCCGMSQRLADMGLTVGSRVSVISGNPCGPLIVDVRGSRLGLGCGMAHKIMVREITNEQKTDCGAGRVITESAIIG
jgi:Fe2+ transport system protein FeoA